MQLANATYTRHRAHGHATIAKINEKSLKIALFCDFDHVVLLRYNMNGFRDQESGFEEGRSQLCQLVGDLVAIESREREERANVQSVGRMMLRLRLGKSNKK